MRQRISVKCPKENIAMSSREKHPYNLPRSQQNSACVEVGNMGVLMRILRCVWRNEMNLG